MSTASPFTTQPSSQRYPTSSPAKLQEKRHRSPYETGSARSAGSGRLMCRALLPSLFIFSPALAISALFPLTRPSPFAAVCLRWPRRACRPRWVRGGPGCGILLSARAGEGRALAAWILGSNALAMRVVANLLLICLVALLAPLQGGPLEKSLPRGQHEAHPSDPGRQCLTYGAVPLCNYCTTTTLRGGGASTRKGESGENDDDDDDDDEWSGEMPEELVREKAKLDRILERNKDKEPPELRLA